MAMKEEWEEEEGADNMFTLLEPIIRLHRSKFFLHDINEKYLPLIS